MGRSKDGSDVSGVFFIDDRFPRRIVLFRVHVPFGPLRPLKESLPTTIKIRRVGRRNCVRHADPFSAIGVLEPVGQGGDDRVEDIEWDVGRRVALSPDRRCRGDRTGITSSLAWCADHVGSGTEEVPDLLLRDGDQLTSRRQAGLPGSGRVRITPLDPDA